MECQLRAKSLVVLTLLQLCRAEVKDVQPQWYSANLINNGFQPKSITELFSTISTEASFSTANPIIVSSTPINHLSEDINLLSTLAPPTNPSSSTTSGFSTTTTFSSSSQSTVPPAPQQYMPQIIPLQLFPDLNQPSSVEIQQQTSPADFELIQPIKPQRNVQIQQSTTQTLPPSSPAIKLTTFYQPPPTDATLSTEIRYDFQDTQSSLGPQPSPVNPSPTNPPLSNYFLIYQQAPQSIQGYPNPSSSPRTTARESSTTISPPVTNTFPPVTTTFPPVTSIFPPVTSTFPPVTRTFPSTFSSPSPSFSTTESPMTIRTSPVYFSTTANLVTQQQLSSFSSPATSLSAISSSSSGPRLVNCLKFESTTPIPSKPTLISRPIPFDGLFPFKIRVSAPSGSITNVHFNPPFKPSTTRKPTTTRKVTTRRTQKPRRNTYDRCLQGCRKNGQTLCAAPLSQNPVDPKTLRGFASVCHMACHNSYRKVPYEKLVDGSCGKLRTRIRPIDSNTKLKKDELTKVQYNIVDNSGPQAILEFSGAYV